MITFAARIAKVARSEGLVTVAGVASDSSPDLFDTRMTTRLFRNFIRHSQDIGMPYLSISHYRTPIGQATKLYVDGRYLKFQGHIDASPPAQELAKRLEDKEFRSRVAFSIGFNDTDSYIDETAGGMLTYTDGELVHLAFTSVPGNPRARLISVEMRARTQLDDAAELVGRTHAAWLAAQDRYLRKGKEQL